MKITATLRDGKCFQVDDGRHVILSDQPVSGGGNDEGPSPVELFAGSLAACAGVFAQAYLDRHDLPYSNLEAVCDYEMASAPRRVGTVDIELKGIEELSPEKLESLYTFVKHCTVHNSLFAPPEIQIRVSESTAKGELNAPK